MASFTCAHCMQLRDALDACVSAMKMQEGRESEELHIPQPAARAIWDHALALAQKVAIEVDGPEWAGAAKSGPSAGDCEACGLPVADKVHRGFGPCAVAAPLPRGGNQP